MSGFNCEHCNTPIIDSDHGYITECEHYPLETIGRKNESNNKPAIQSTHMESNSSHEPLGEKEAPRFDTPVNITVVSYRKRKHDTDGISAKAAIDGLVHAGILQDDSREEVKKVTFQSNKCEKGEAEKTIIIIETVEE